MGFVIALWTPLGATASSVMMCPQPMLEPMPQSSGHAGQQGDRDGAPLSEGRATEVLAAEELAPKRLFDDGEQGEPSEGNIAWCATPDDPRCGQRPADPGSTRVEGRTPVNAVSDAASDERWPYADAGMTAHYGPGQSAGVDSRLERPPRGHR